MLGVYSGSSTIKLWYSNALNISKKIKHGTDWKTTLQSINVWKKKYLISGIDHSLQSKLPAFCSCQRYHIMQWGTALQKVIIWCLPKLLCYVANKSRTLCGITPWIPNTLRDYIWIVPFLNINYTDGEFWELVLNDLVVSYGI